MTNLCELHPVTLLPRRFEDARGWFAETYSERAFAALGVTDHFVQDNHSFSNTAFTLRGLHFQTPPRAQAKLVRCLKGRIFDVAVDIRKASPSFGRWVGVELSSEAGEQFLVPKGFLHGFLTLSDGTEVAYKVSDFYDRDTDTGVRWDDPHLGIHWPLPQHQRPLLSPKDASLPCLWAIESPFEFGPDDIPLTSLKEIIL